MVNAKKNIFEDDMYVLLELTKGGQARKKILEILQFRPRNCNQVAHQLGSDWWTVHKHLRHLIRTGLVSTIDFGRIKFYKLTPKGESALKLVSSKVSENNLLEVSP